MHHVLWQGNRQHCGDIFKHIQYCNPAVSTAADWLLTIMYGMMCRQLAFLGKVAIELITMERVSFGMGLGMLDQLRALVYSCMIT